MPDANSKQYLAGQRRYNQEVALRSRQTRQFADAARPIPKRQRGKHKSGGGGILKAIFGNKSNGR